MELVCIFNTFTIFLPEKTGQKTYVLEENTCHTLHILFWTVVICFQHEWVAQIPSLLDYKQQKDNWKKTPHTF